MKEGNIDEYVATFDTLIAQAGYKANDAQMLEKFISGLPASLYETIYQLDDPKTYEGWRRAAIKRQEKWLHMQSIKQGRRTLESFKQQVDPATTSIGFSHPHPGIQTLWTPQPGPESRVVYLSLTTLQSTKKMRNHRSDPEKGFTAHNKSGEEGTCQR
jgi:hypothetical protein